MKVIKISIRGMGFYYSDDIEDAIEELRQEYKCDSILSITFKMVEMSKDKYDKLPEFQGW